MVILFATVLAGLAWSESGSARPPLVRKAGTELGPGTIVRSQVVRIWIPEALLEAATVESPPGIESDHADLRRLVEGRHQENLQYAVTVRGYQVNGDHADITLIRHPYEDSRCSREFLEILARLARRQDGVATAGIANASVHIIADDLLSRGPAEVLAELERR